MNKRFFVFSFVLFISGIASSQTSENEMKILGKWKLVDYMFEKTVYFKDNGICISQTINKEAPSEILEFIDKYKFISQNKISMDPGNNLAKVEITIRINGDTLVMSNRTTGTMKYIKQK